MAQAIGEVWQHFGIFGIKRARKLLKNRYKYLNKKGI
jgi:hypothetical protein